LFFGHLFLWFFGVGAIYAGYRMKRRTEKQQEKAEEILRDTAETLGREYQFKSAVLERAAEGLCVCHEIPEHPYVLFTLWNNKMTEITGYTMEEINRSGWYQTVYPDPGAQSRARERMQRMRQGDDMLQEEWEITHSDGSKRIVSISTSVITISPDEHHVLALMVDVTEKKKADKNLLTLVSRQEA
jgi:PAS domain S-box-containing protein